MFFFTNFEIMPSKSKVCFFFQDVKFSLSNRSELKGFIQQIFRNEGKKTGSLNIVFCTDKALLKINSKFLGHDFYTDIITFDLSDNTLFQAEMYLSIDRIRDNARKIGVSFKSEIHRVIFHGVLHLCGYKDKTRLEKIKIRKREDLYLKKYKIAIA